MLLLWRMFKRCPANGNAGARLTAFELVHDGLPATLICDSAAASLMQAGKVRRTRLRSVLLQLLRSQNATWHVAFVVHQPLLSPPAAC